MKTTEVIRMCSENNIDLLFFASENIFFHLWKYNFYSFRIYINFTACKKTKIHILDPFFYLELYKPVYFHLIIRDMKNSVL